MAESLQRQILTELRDQGQKQDDIMGRVVRVETLLAGNGTKGLCQRLEDVEKLKDKLWRLLGIAAGIGVIITFIGQAIGKPLIQAIVKALAG